MDFDTNPGGLFDENPNDYEDPFTMYLRSNGANITPINWMED